MSGLTIGQVQKAYIAGTFTARELVQAYFDRIESVDKSGPRLNSILARSTTALQEADELDIYLRATEHLEGSLHGIPTIAKDQIENKGIITTFASTVARNHIPNEDASLVKKLKNSGAAIIAKSTVPGE